MFAFALVHLALLGWDRAEPEIFLLCDRAAPRWAILQRLAANGFGGPGFVAVLAANGNPGDYLPQAWVWHAFGREALILSQAALSLASGAAVWQCGRWLGLSDRRACVAAGLYMAWPHSLVLSHQLATEAWHTPMLVLGTTACLRGWRPGASAAWWVGGALLLGLAALVRPVTLLWPVLLSVLLAVALPRTTGHGETARSGRRAVGMALLGLLPVLGWCLWMDIQTGSFGIGASSRDLGHNLYQRTARIVATLPLAEAEVERLRFVPEPEGTMSLSRYAAFVQAHPWAAAQHGVRDAAVFLFKSGLERVPIDYLGFNPEARAGLQDANTGWRRQLETRGLAAALSTLWVEQGAVLLLGLAGVPVMLVAWLLAARGALHTWRGARPGGAAQSTSAVLVALLLYVAILSSVVDTVQSRHRAPAEFALALLAVAGWRSGVRRDPARP